MLIVNFCAPTILLTSVACTVNVDGPAVFGVPVIAPLLGSIPKPSGKAPVAINHVQHGRTSFAMRSVLATAAKFFCRNSSAANRWTCYRSLLVISSTKNTGGLRKNISAFS